MNVRTTIAILSLMFVMAGCSSNKPLQQPAQGVHAQTIDGHAAASTDGLRFSAVVTPDSEVPLGFRIPGYVISLKQVRGQDGRMRDIAEGDRVTRGAALVRIRSSEYEDKVHQASSQAAAAEAVALKAKLDFDRATHLYDSQSLTKTDFDSAHAQYDSSQEQVKSARALTSEAQIALRDTSLIAPFDGDIVKKAVEMGAFVGPGVPAFALAKTDTVKIIVGVPDTVVRSVRLGQPVDVGIDAFPTRTFHARVSRLSSAADPVTRNFEVEVAIPNHDHLLRVGMIGSLQLANADGGSRGSALLVPLSAVVQAKDGKYGVFVVSDSSAGEVARLHSIEIGAVNGTDISIVNGLQAGDRIITTGANLLKDGQRVEVLQ
jgi:multidrug efflux system membrane fusion protein